MVQTVTARFISKFIEKHELPYGVRQTLKVWFTPIAEQLALHQNRAGRPIVLGINGCQGSGKTTLTDYLFQYLRAYYGLNVVSLSLDDYYLSKKERQSLAQSEHALFETRGVPGTHKIAQLKHDLSVMRAEHFKGPVFVRRFDKGTDDPKPVEQWTKVTTQPDIIIVEGWCAGLKPQDECELTTPVNALEQEKDNDGTWRRYVNQQLESDYAAVFDMVDRWVMLKAPSFNVVADWRKQQEAKLRASRKAASGIMSEQQIEEFVMYFERLTEHGLKHFASDADIVFHLNDEREIYDVSGHYKTLCFPQKLAIFTDLDGTLLDHYNYDFHPAKPSIFICHELDFPIIPITSKTYKELIVIRKEIGLSGPFIVENGAAIFLPKQWLKKHVCDTKDMVEFGDYFIKEFGKPRDFWLKQIKLHAQDLKHLFKGFSEMNSEELAMLTGLTVKQAERAKLRHYSEPVQWRGDVCQKRAFIKRMKSCGASVVEGGRFLHIGAGEHKGQALEWLIDFMRNEISGDWLSVALGDSENDSPMLEVADIAVQIKSHNHGFIPLKRTGKLMQSRHPGPVGWYQSIMQLISELDNHRLDRIKTLNVSEEQHYG